MAKFNISRRDFIRLSSAVAAVAFIGISCDGGGGNQSSSDEAVMVYRLSVRGRRGSNASKKHNANHLFLTPEAADQNRAHPGDRSRIVSIELSNSRFNELFDGGATEVADLRDFF